MFLILIPSVAHYHLPTFCTLYFNHNSKTEVKGQKRPFWYQRSFYYNLAFKHSENLLKLVVKYVDQPQNAK